MSRPEVNALRRRLRVLDTALLACHEMIEKFRAEREELRARLAMMKAQEPK